MSESTQALTRLIEETVREHVEAELTAWEEQELAASLARRGESREQYLSGSRRPVKRVYTAADVADIPYEEIGLPGQYPFTRGPYPTMYRARPWTMRQIAGFGTPDETNERFQYLIAQGQTGLSVDFDMPTLMGFDSDDPKSVGEVGREGVAIDVLEDMDRLFAGIDLEQISVSMTINPSAWILLAMYIAVAEQRGLDLNKLSGTIQNDILKEYIAQKEWIYPPEPSMRIVRDTITYTAGRMARYNPINISGYHISEAGSSAIQEAAFTIATTREYVRRVTATGLDVDAFAPRLSFFFVCQADFFEEVAKFRALRRCYARMMKEEFGARNPESMRMRFHTQTAAATLTKPQPLNNIVRTAIQALAAVLGGTQSLHTNGLDEAYAIPSELAMKVALRTQQIIAEETNVTQVIDPLGGSYYVEALTRDFEQAINDYLDKIEEIGGTLPAIEQNYFQREIADFAYEFAQRKASAERTVVGVNRFVDQGEEQEIEVHRIDPTSERRKIERLKEIKRTRDDARVTAALEELARVASDPDANLMPATIEAVRAHASMGEIVTTLEQLFGRYTETPVF
ncbi:methylmalonyl-CoA mutase family protein [Conexibacter sp. JD483]|uniref:methylmalonyl-CoA mutase family protein n=1 Tax=unclassified Conexibacter TaxID=2627773 RepID=UPI00271AAF69|nr:MULTISPECIES: methylmalonyl-CoA mutase family protein [unclassified Conexibacter]MDO8187940.1 methylmalonyl-CoA mutase family protein [Conexibacter sp. CPCC 205706]MDO8200191.1 methylmalonyl-CoA mutase family protein [Conexibacter sp. CPCC 205762]MDR9369737.1 methylmalonyl-CoA mutase family protein [Conexibacter sp. JD483]